MQIKSLEIQGFKSFPDKVKLTFDQGITAVVGPNGSGKSNIVDAVRWVFGEQSTKTLRGSRMEDVIFGGTAKRKPQGSAMVNLVLDNSDRLLPVDSDEISITRKLYRSGESEYRLGGASVRLKDIYELFMDTGLGRDGYSVIGQGRIAEIISSRSSERREIFEEAAGISKYRYRRGEAQRRLDAAEENMLRLRDILSELEGRVEPLRKEAEKAREYLALADERRTLEIGVWLAKIDQLSAQYRELQDKFLAARGEYDSLAREEEGMEERINLLYTQMQDCAVTADGLRTRLREWEAEAAQIRSDQAVGENNIAHSRESIASLEAEHRQGLEHTDADQAAAAEAEKRIAALEQAGEEIRSRLTEETARAQQNEKQLAELDGEIESLKFRRTAIYKQIDDARFSGAASQSLLEETHRRLEEIRQASGSRDGELERTRQELAECEELLAGTDARQEEFQNARKGWEMRLQSRKERWQQLADQLAAVQNEAAQKRQRAGILEGMEKSLEGYTYSVKFILQQSSRGMLRGVHGSVSQLVAAADPRYSTAIEIALGAGMQNIVVEDENAAKQCIRLLDRERKGRATFLPMTAVRGRRMDDREFAGMEGAVGIASSLVTAESRYSGIVEHLLGRILIAEDLDCAVTIAKRCGYKFRIVTLDGQVINTGGAMTGGYTAKSAGLLGRRGEIDQLEAEAAALEQKAAEQERTLTAAREEISRIEAQIWSIDAGLREVSDDRIRAEGEKKRLEQILASAGESAAKEKAEEAALAARVEQLTGENRSAETVLSGLTGELDQVSAKIEALQEERRKADEAGRDQERRKAALDLQRLEQEKDLAAAKAERERLTARQEDSRNRLAEIRERIAELERSIQTDRSAIEAGSMRLEQLSEQTVTANERIRQSEETRRDCEQKVSSLRSQSRELSARKETHAREAARLDERLQAAGSERDQVVAKLWESYELTPTMAVQQVSAPEDPAEAERRLTAVRSRIRGLGSVNVGAVEEYEEVSQRYSFLSAQLDDVEKSKRELGRLIEELTSQMRQLFLESFGEINRHFGQIFTELFGGGRAELLLEDPADPLGCGIEIKVQPPGKVIKNLAALSGGEQAFVAIAIYFAILKVNPAPFVILDEIEAALDDVNVAKYARYLRSMTGHTQFIAITHRRGTMEEADVLYGVTMQEEGVSKLIELRVGELEEKLGIGAGQNA